MKRILLLLVAVVLVTGCYTKSSKPTITTRGDPLLGRWVCLADNVHEKPNATLDFQADGTATLVAEGEKPVTMRYRREPGRDWVARRREGLTKQGIDLGTDPSPFKAWEQPGVEMVYFADPTTGDFMDSGGWLLILDPKEKVLTNPLTFLWCRPGDEERVREKSGMNAQAKRDEEYAQKQKAWKPAVDITKQFRIDWTVELDFDDRQQCSILTGDLSGDGLPEIITSTREGFATLSSTGEVLNEVSVNTRKGRHLVLCRQNGKALIGFFGSWSDKFDAYHPDGSPAWSSAISDKGIDWVAAVELDPQNTGIIIGYNGGGAEFLSPDGRSRWKADIDANVWQVAGARLKKTLPAYALCVGAGEILAFDVHGKQFRRFGPVDAGALGAADLDGDGIDEVLALGTTVVSGGNLTVFGADGEVRWSKKASTSESAFLDGVLRTNLAGKIRIGIASHSSIHFFSSSGSDLGDLVVPGGITAVGTLDAKGQDSRILVRVGGKLICYSPLPAKPAAPR